MNLESAMCKLTRSPIMFFYTRKCQQDGCPDSWSRITWNNAWQSAWDISCIAIMMTIIFFFSFLNCDRGWNVSPPFNTLIEDCICGVEISINSLWKKFKTTLSASKVLLTVFWDAQGVLLFNCFKIGIINAVQYCHTLSKLKEAICKEAACLLPSGILLLTDNERQHSVTAIQKHTATFKWEGLYHPLYTYLKSSGFHLFLALKKNLDRRCFGSNAEVTQAVQCFFHVQSPDFFPGELFEAYKVIWQMSQLTWYSYKKNKVKCYL